MILGSLRSPRQRRQRTTSINLTKTIDATESIIRANNRTIYTAGRPPWYNCAGQQVEPFVIGLLNFLSKTLQRIPELKSVFLILQLALLRYLRR